jgi:hypothetical protein
MSDDLAKRLRETTHIYQVDCELKMKCADRIEELEANRLANKIAIMRLEAKLRQLTEIGNTQTKPADLSAGLPNSINDTAP